MTYLYDSLDVVPDFPELGRTLVSYDRHGLTLQSWRQNEDDNESEMPFEYRECWASWERARKRARNYPGRLKDRIRQALQDELAEWASVMGLVDDTQTIIDDYGNPRHW